MNLFVREIGGYKDFPQPTEFINNLRLPIVIQLKQIMVLLAYSLWTHVYLVIKRTFHEQIWLKYWSLFRRRTDRATKTDMWEKTPQHRLVVGWRIMQALHHVGEVAHSCEGFRQRIHGRWRGRSEEREPFVTSTWPEYTRTESPLLGLLQYSAIPLVAAVFVPFFPPFSLSK